jgi:hypothetical protein
MNEAAEIQAILRLMNEYCYRIDAGDKLGFAQLFEHGTFLLRGDPTGGLSGTQALLDMLDNVILYDGKPQTKHVMSNESIEVHPDGKTASAQCYIAVYQALPDFPLQPIFMGHYFDTFEKVDSAWRFKLREISPDLIGDLSRHRADMA